MVRTAIELKYIEDVPRRRVCFSKRKRGLKKKAYELSVLCNAEVGLIVISDTGKLYEFSSSSMPEILGRYNGATTRPSAPRTRAQPDMSQLLAQQAEEIRRLNQKLMILEADNMSMQNELEELAITNPPFYYENDNMETALSLRPPLNAADPLNTRAQMLQRGSGSSNPANRMEM